MDLHAQRRELTILAIAVVGLSRLLETPLIWLVAALLAASMAVGTAYLLGVTRPRELAPGAVVLPALAAAATLEAMRLVPLGILVLPALAAAWVLIDRTLAFETGLAATLEPATGDERTLALGYAIVIAFLAFTGVAAVVPGGLADPAAGAATPSPLSETALLVLAGADALVGALLGFRVALLRERTIRGALWSAVTYGAVIAIAAAAVRAVAMPRLLGPALLTLVFFVWDGVHGAPPAQRSDPRWIWQTVLLVVLGGAVIAWNVALRR